MKKLFLKQLIAMTTAITTILGLPLGTNAEWKKDSNGWWNTEGNSWSVGWRYIDNNWYYFDSRGYMKTGWINDGGTWYYADSSGSMKTGWVKDSGKWYYMDKSGSMKTGWINDGGTWYYTDNSGSMKTGWVKDREKWYYMDKSGSMKTGWISDGGTWYYTDKSGSMKTGWVKDNEKWYYMDNSGSMKTGWVKDGDKWYFTSSSGDMQTGVIQVDNEIYYLNDSGAMQTGAIKIDNKIYNFDESGKNIDSEKPEVSKTFNKDASEIIEDNTESIPSEDENNSNNNSSSNNSNGSGNSNSQSQKIEIEKIETVRNGVLKVYLNKATSVALTKDAFAISCPGLGEMTIISVENSTGSDANRVYTLNITYYDDNIYTVHINLPNGTSIEKEFESRYDCPEISSPIMKRINDTTAEFYYVSDAEGTFYYMLEEKEAARSRSYSKAATPTEEEIIASGISSKMKVHENTIEIANLKENTSYIMYYVAKDVDGKVTLVKSEVIDSVVIPETDSIKIVDIKAHSNDKADMFDYRYWFTFELSEPTASPLTLENFTITCPSDGNLTLGKLETEDNKIYNVYMEKGYVPKDNNTFKGTITFDNGTSIEKGFYVDLTAPIISDKEISRTSPSEVELTIKSNEGGILYYSILDEVSEDISAKDPTEIYATGKQSTINYGTNIIKIQDDAIATGKWLCFATEDEYKNRAMYYSYIKIPEYIPSEDGGTVEEELAITDVQAGKDYIDVTFNKDVNTYSIDNGLTEITNIGGKGLYELTQMSSNKIRVKIINMLTIGSGNHTVILYSDGKKLSYTFTV